MKRYLFPVILIAFIALVLSIAAIAEKKPTSHKPPPGFPVKVLTLEQTEVGNLLKYSGTVKPNMQASVYSSINGRMDEIKVGGGKLVKKGQILGYVVNDTPGYRYVKHPVKAPFKGIITSIGFDPGSAVKTSDELFEVTNLDVFYFLSYVPQHEAHRIKKGAPAVIRLDAFGQSYELASKVAGFSSTADDDSGLEKLWIELGSTDKKIKVRMTGEVFLQVNRHKGILVPRDAVVWRNLNPVVFVVAPNEIPEKEKKKTEKKSKKKPKNKKEEMDLAKFVAKAREVKLGISVDNRVEILEGLKPGERVVVVGAGSLTNNRGIHIAEQK